MNIFTQVVGFCGVALLIASYQCKSSRRMFFVQLCSNILYIIHFLLLGAYTGCVSMVINVARNFILTGSGDWARKKFWPWFFIAVSIFVAIVTWHDVYSLFPTIATIVFTVSAFTRNGKKICILNLTLGSPAWIIYDIHMRSWFGLTGEIICICSIIVSIARYGMKSLDTNE